MPRTSKITNEFLHLTMSIFHKHLSSIQVFRVRCTSTAFKSSCQCHLCVTSACSEEMLCRAAPRESRGHIGMHAPFSHRSPPLPAKRRIGLVNSEYQSPHCLYDTVCFIFVYMQFLFFFQLYFLYSLFNSVLNKYGFWFVD